MGSHYDHIDRLQDLAISMRKEEDMTVRPPPPPPMRPDPVDNAPAERLYCTLTSEEYRILRNHGYSTREMDDRCNDGSIHAVLDRLRTPAHPLEPSPPPSREYPFSTDPFTRAQWEIADAPKAKTEKAPSGYSVMGSTALKRVLTKDSLPDAIDRLKGEMVETIREELKIAQVSLEAAPELVDRAINIRISASQDTFFDPDGDRRYEDRVNGHPGQLNQFMLDVAANGGNIVSIIAIAKEVILVHYKIPNDVKITLDRMQSR